MKYLDRDTLIKKPRIVSPRSRWLAVEMTVRSPVEEATGYLPTWRTLIDAIYDEAERAPWKP